MLTSNPTVVAAPPPAVIVATPVVQPILTVWQEGNRCMNLWEWMLWVCDKASG